MFTKIVFKLNGSVDRLSDLISNYLNNKQKLNAITFYEIMKNVYNNIYIILFGVIVTRLIATLYVMIFGGNI